VTKKIGAAVVFGVLVSLLSVGQVRSMSLDDSTRACLIRTIGKAATNKIASAKTLSAAQNKAVAKCKSAAGSASGTSSGKEPWYFEGWNWDYTTALARTPACTEQYPLKVLPAPIDTVVQMNRRGYSQPGYHALPVPHHNIWTRDLRGTGSLDEGGHTLVSERVNPIVMPGNGTIIGLAKNTYGRHELTGEVYTYIEWMIAIHICGTKYIVFNHVDDIPAAWVTATAQPGIRSECQPAQDRATVCMYSGLKIPVKQGDRVGRASGRSAGWDIGGWDTSRPTPGVMDPGKWTGRWATGECVWDWFTPSLKSAMFAKLIGDKTSCGTHGYDVPNTLSGVWLAIGKRARAFSEDLHIALFPSYKNDGTYRFSIGYDSNIPTLAGGIYEFRAQSSGLYNPVFSTVSPGQVACFDTFDGYYTKSTTVTRIFAKMDAGSTEKIQIAGDTGGLCGSGPYSMPANPTTFERINKTTG
jgi:hypothetical protein